MGMSRTPFRQALHRLALEGLVMTVPQRGTFVTPLDPADIENNMRVREAIEIEMARLTIEQERDVDFDILEARLRQQKDAIETGDWLEFLGVDEVFHQEILTTAGNARAVEAVQRCWLHVNRVRYVMPLSRSAMRVALGQHRDIVEGLRAGDPERTEAAIRRHLEGPLLTTLEHLARHLPAAFDVARGDGS
jgi:DNA-binding GntR family transcriptional regulator